jgi:hypothetical protein
VQQKEELLSKIQEFKDTFDEYFKAFMEYLNGGIKKDSEFQLGHSTLFTFDKSLWSSPQ